MDATPDPTPKQLEALKIIVEFRNANGYPPTIRELSSALGKSPTNVWEIVDRLRGKRLILDFRNAARSAVPSEAAQTLIERLAPAESDADDVAEADMPPDTT
jgi:SOS-response transcriptional repressor LexA